MNSGHKNRALTRTDAAIIVISIFGSWFIGSYLAEHDWAYALGSAVWSLLLGLGVVGTINARRARKARKSVEEFVNDALDLSKAPETPWVEILLKEKARMPAEQYEKFESAVLELVKNIGVVNRSGLTTQAEKMALLEKLTKSSAGPQN